MVFSDLFALQDDQSSGGESAPSSAASVNWSAPGVPAGYPWPTPPHMPAMPPMGVRPPMMFGPPHAGFPPGNFHQPPRLPFNAPPETAGEDSEEAGAGEEVGKPERAGGAGDNCTEDGLQREDDNAANAAFMGNFPRPPMAAGDWRMRGPVPFMHGPNMPRPDLMRGPRPLLGESPPRPRSLLRAPPRLPMPQSFPNPEEEEEEGEEYYNEYGDEGENEEEAYDEEEYDEEGEEFYLVPTDIRTTVRCDIEISYTLISHGVIC